jgi:integrase
VTLFRRSTSKYWYSRIEVNKHVYQFSTKTTNKNTARSIEAAYRMEKTKGLAGLSVPTFSEFSRQFINDGIVGRVSGQTFRYYVCHWKVLVDPDCPLADTRLDRIDRAAIDGFISWRRKQRVSATTVNHNLRVLRRALHLAVEWNLLRKPPKIKLLPGEKQREYVLPDATVEEFAKESGMIGKVVPFLVDTGLRRREICNLLWHDVSSNGAEIHITKGKTKFARRRIPLTSRAQKILTKLPRRGEHVFTDRHGHGITADWISHAFLDARRRLNQPKEGESSEDVKKRQMPDDCVLHSTRHTFCTRLGEAGADAFAIQRLAGHSSITISQRYVHPTAGKLDSAIALLEKR